jgi:ferredoxin
MKQPGTHACIHAVTAVDGVQLQAHKEKKAQFERELDGMRSQLIEAELAEQHTALSEAIEACPFSC